MRTGVPDEFLHGDVDNYTPDWAPSLEERFHSTVKAWLRRGSWVAKKAAAAAATGAGRGGAAPTPPLPGMAFVPSPVVRGKMDICQARANDQQNQRWMSLAEIGGKHPERSAAFRVAPVARRGGSGGHAVRGSCPHGIQMLLGFRSRGGFPSRRRVLGGGGSNGVTPISPEQETMAGVRSSGGSGEGNINVQNNFDGVGGDDVKEVLSVSAARTLAAPGAPRAISEVGRRVSRGNRKNVSNGAGATKNDDDYQNGILSNILDGAADAYDSALSFVGCALVTSPLGKRYLNAYDDAHTNTVPASAIRSGDVPSMDGSGYNLVGFSNIDPLEASARRGGGSTYRLLQ